MLQSPGAKAGANTGTRKGRVQQLGGHARHRVVGEATRPPPPAGAATQRHNRTEHARLPPASGPQRTPSPPSRCPRALGESSGKRCKGRARRADGRRWVRVVGGRGRAARVQQATRRLARLPPGRGQQGSGGRGALLRGGRARVGSRVGCVGDQPSAQTRASRRLPCTAKRTAHGRRQKAGVRRAVRTAYAGRQASYR